MPSPARLLSTPVSQLLKGRVTGAGSHKTVISEAQLPPELAGYAHRVVRKTRLRRREKVEAAEHVVLCLLKELEEQPDGSTVLAVQPPARQAAKVLRRDIVSRRGWWGRVTARLGRKLAVTACLFMALYAVQFCRFYLQRPRISHNYAGEFNATIATVAESDRAWDLIRRLGPITPEEQPLGKLWAEVWPEDEAWPTYAAYVASRAPQIQMIRDASRRKVLGFYISRNEIQLEGDQVFSPQVLPANEDNPLVLAWLMPYAGKLRACTRLLMADARVAASEGGSARATEDLLAILRLAPMANQPAINIGELVSVAMMAAASNTLFDLVERYPTLFDDAQLAQLASAFAGYGGGGRLQPHFGYDLHIVEDLVQRCYTDDGRGDGHFCGVGLRHMDEMADPPNQFGAAPYILGPLNMHRFASRQEVLDEARRIVAAHEAFAAQELWERDEDLGTIMAERINATRSASMMLLGILLGHPMTTYANCMETATLQRDSTVALLAMERFRLRHGSWPASLDALSPEFLSKPPVDRFDGKPLKYVLTDSGPILYSVGTDRKDDGGRPPPHPYDAMKVLSPGDQSAAADGDWVLWPRPREPSQSE
jgi:hypothetical protein